MARAVGSPLRLFEGPATWVARDIEKAPGASQRQGLSVCWIREYCTQNLTRRPAVGRASPELRTAIPRKGVLIVSPQEKDVKIIRRSKNKRPAVPAAGLFPYCLRGVNMAEGKVSVTRTSGTCKTCSDYSLLPLRSSSSSADLSMIGSRFRIASQRWASVLSRNSTRPAKSRNSRG